MHNTSFCLLFRNITKNQGRVESAYEPSVPSGPELIAVSVASGDLEYFYSPLDGMPHHRSVTPEINSPVPIYTAGWREAL